MTPAEQYGIDMGERPRFEMFVYADDVDEVVRALRDEGVRILRTPAETPW